jgi:hypothetical protein
VVAPASSSPTALKTEPVSPVPATATNPPTDEPTPVAVSAETAAPPAAVQAPVVVRHYNGHTEDEILHALDDGNITSARSVGNTSLNFHVDLDGPIDGGYKPSETQHLEHYRGEVAAFRFNRLMNLERVPPAVLRKVGVESVRRLPQEVLDRAHIHRGQLRGAMIYWVPTLRQIGLNGRAWVGRWMRWLKHDGAMPDDMRWRAEEISTAIAFDYMTGNWDRWNGDNTLVDADGHLVYRDNNGAFYEQVGERRMSVLNAWLHRTERFSRAFIDRARTLTAQQIADEVNRDIDPRRPLLTEAQIAGVLARRDTLIHYVDGLVAQYGEQAVYAFP